MSVEQLIFIAVFVLVGLGAAVVGQIGVWQFVRPVVRGRGGGRGGWSVEGGGWRVP